MVKHSEACICYVPVAAFSEAIVLGSMRWGSEVGYTMSGKVFFESSVFTSIIGVEGYNFSVKVIFDYCFKFGKDGDDIGFAVHRVKPNVFGEVVNKNNVKTKTSIGHNRSRAPNVRVD